MLANKGLQFRLWDGTAEGDIPKSLLKGLQTIFYKTYKAVPTYFQDVAMIVNSTAHQENYAWIGQAPQMREFGAERIPKGLSDFGFSIINKEFESSIRVKRTALEDDQTGQIRIRVEAMADKAAKYKDRLVFGLLELGISSACYDGANFFSASHSEGLSGTQSNYATVALSAAQYGVVRAAMMQFKDDSGDLCGITPSHLVVPPALEATARAILNADFISDGTTTVSNVWKGSAQLIVVPYLTDTNDWYLMDLTAPVKPIILQIRNDVEFSALERDSEQGFMRRDYLYGIYMRCNVGYGDWRYAFGSHV